MPSFNSSFLLISLFFLGLLSPIASAQSIPPALQVAESGQAPDPTNKNIINITQTQGSRSSLSINANHTFGVTTDANRSGNGDTQSSALMAPSSASSMSTRMGTDNLIQVTNTTNQKGTMPGALTPDLKVDNTSSNYSSVSGVQSSASLPIQSECSDSCLNGSRFSSDSKTYPLVNSATSPSQGSLSSSSGSAKGFLNSSVSTDTSQSSFSNVLINSF